MTELDLFKVLSAGGDIGVWALVFVLWRFHERLLALEIILGIRNKGNLPNVSFKTTE